MKISLPHKKTIKKILSIAVLGAAMGILYAAFTAPVSLAALTAIQLATAATYGVLFISSLFGAIQAFRFSLKRFLKLDNKLVDAVTLEYQLPIIFIRFLIWAGADVNARLSDTLGLDTLLIRAVENGHIDIVKELLKVPGIQVNLQNSYGYTALLWAVMWGHIDIAKELLKVPGIQINLENKDGKTALTFAEEQENHETISDLLNAMSAEELELSLQKVTQESTKEAIAQKLVETAIHPTASFLEEQVVFQGGINGPLEKVLSYVYPEESRWLPFYTELSTKQRKEMQKNSSVPAQSTAQAAAPVEPEVVIPNTQHPTPAP